MTRVGELHADYQVPGRCRPRQEAAAPGGMTKPFHRPVCTGVITLAAAGTGWRGSWLALRLARATGTATPDRQATAFAGVEPGRPAPVRLRRYRPRGRPAVHPTAGLVRPFAQGSQVPAFPGGTGAPRAGPNCRSEGGGPLLRGCEVAGYKRLGAGGPSSAGIRPGLRPRWRDARSSRRARRHRQHREGHRSPLGTRRRLATALTGFHRTGLTDGADGDTGRPPKKETAPDLLHPHSATVRLMTAPAVSRPRRESTHTGSPGSLPRPRPARGPSSGAGLHAPISTCMAGHEDRSLARRRPRYTAVVGSTAQRAPARRVPGCRGHRRPPGVDVEHLARDDRTAPRNELYAGSPPSALSVGHSAPAEQAFRGEHEVDYGWRRARAASGGGDELRVRPTAPAASA